jgi:hypothetical protein
MTTTRMLLSHNFDIVDTAIPALSRIAFTDVFVQALDDCGACRLVDHTHWVVEVRFEDNQFTPAQMGDRYVQALASARRSTLTASTKFPEILALGGLKSTPPMSDSPDALQMNEWGVDIVETLNADAFLSGLGWAGTVSSRAPGTIFKSVFK